MTTARSVWRWQARLAWPQRPAVAWSETLAVSLLVPALSLLAQTPDPMGLLAPFPWGWFAPALLALRHGVLSALFSVLLLVGFQLGLAPQTWDGAGTQLHLLGGLSLVLMLSQFAGLWHNRLRREAELLGYSQEQLRTLTREHFLLRLSHERLEQELVLRPGSLNDAIHALDQHLHQRDDTTHLPQAERLLHLLAEYCRLDAAALHLLQDDGTPERTPLASLGTVPTPDRQDPLIHHALACGQLSHMASTEQPSAYQVVAPLQGAGAVRALLLVSDMPFLALEPENLQTLNLILASYSDLVEREHITTPLLAQAPDCPAAFAFALHRLWRARTVAGVTSHRVTLQGPDNARVRGHFEALLAGQRMLDAYWLSATDHALRLHILLPLGSRLQAEGLLDRLATQLHAQHGAAFDDWALSAAVQPIDQPPATLLAQLLGDSP